MSWWETTIAAVCNNCGRQCHPSDDRVGHNTHLCQLCRALPRVAVYAPAYGSTVYTYAPAYAPAYVPRVYAPAYAPTVYAPAYGSTDTMWGITEEKKKKKKKKSGDTVVWKSK